jgi:outer membrane protein assembly factor BamB
MGITTGTLLRLAFTLLSLGSCGAVAASVADESTYAPSGWATLHQSGANRRAQPIDLPTRFSSWHALAGASVLTAPTVGPEGNVYVTTGLPRGHANLYAFTLDGKPLWQMAPWQNKSDFDACAILSSPIVDRDGDIYISDCNQLWAFKPDGRTKWVVDLPPPPPDAPLQQRDLPVNAFTTAVFTRDGDVLGVTNFGQVVVIDRATGSLRADVFQLPGLIPAPSTKHKLSAGILGQNLMEPSLREWAWQLMLGGDMRSANTPAVAADGRIFVAATSTEPGLGALYALDLLPQADGKLRIVIAFASNMGPGSGSSPSLSPDEKQVYVSDERGMFYAFDTHGGGQIWQVQTDAAAAAAAVAPDGTIIALQEGDAFDIAIAPDGRRLWESDIDALIKQALPRRWYLGGPIAISTGNPVVVNRMVISPVLYCYALGWGGWQIPLPIKSMLVAIDLRSGRGIKNILELPDDSSGITAVLPDGTIINSLGALLTSATQPLLRFTRWLLPDNTPQMPARGGIHIARPVQAAAQIGAQ